MTDLPTYFLAAEIEFQLNGRKVDEIYDVNACTHSLIRYKFSKYIFGK